MQIATMKVRVKGGDAEESVINASEFNEELHEQIGDINDPEQVLDQIARTRDLEHLAELERQEMIKPKDERDPEVIDALYKKRLQLTYSGPRRAQVRTVVDPGEVEDVEPMLVPRSHNANIRSDREGSDGGQLSGGGEGVGGSGSPFDPIGRAKSPEELDRLAESIENRRKELAKAEEDKGENGDGDDKTAKVLDGTVVDVRSAVADIEDEAELDALEKAEKKGSKRQGVLDAIERRREALDKKE